MRAHTVKSDAFEAPATAFDSFESEYDAALNQGLTLSGEDKHYFSRGRLAWLARCLKRQRAQPRTVLDFGCGTGSATPDFFELLGIESVLGVDLSGPCLRRAERDHGSPKARFRLAADLEPDQRVDLAFCNGVFHHIPPEARARWVGTLYRTIRGGGWLSFWENNPWNPGTRLVMRRIPFDRDAIPLSPLASLALLRAGGFEVVQISFLFVFPRVLGWFRPAEPLLSRLPIGAQYQVLCKKPVDTDPAAPP